MEQIPKLDNKSAEETNSIEELKLGIDIEKNKEYFRSKFRKEEFIKGFEYDSMGNIADERYEEFINFYAEFEAIIESFLDGRNIDDKSIPFIGQRLIEWNMPVDSKTFDTVQTNPYHFNFKMVSMTTDALYIEEHVVERFIKFEPDIVAVAPRSAVIPATFLKSLADEYSKQENQDYKPYFFIPPNKSYKLLDQTNHYGKFYGLGEEIYKASGSGNLEIQKKYLLDVYKKNIKPEKKNIMNRINAFFEACEKTKETILSVLGDKKDLKVMVFDEFVSYGQNIKGLEFLFEVSLEMLKLDGIVKDDVKLIKSSLTLQNEALSNNATGKGFIEYDNDLGKKGGSEPEHHFFRKAFRLFGKYIMKDYLLRKRSQQGAV